MFLVAAGEQVVVTHFSEGAMEMQRGGQPVHGHGQRQTEPGQAEGF